MTISYGSVASPLMRNPRDRPRPERGDDSDSDDEDVSSEELVKRAESFTMPYDDQRGYRSTELKFLSFARPYMRAFHGSWICLFVSLCAQYAIPPLLPEIKASLKLTKAEVWLSNVWATVGGVPFLFMLGPLSDKYGGRLMATLLLALIAIPCALTGLVTTLEGLLFVRLLIGCLDNSVPCQYWISCHFVREISGTAMAISSGLGATGSGVIQLVIGSILFSFCVLFTGNNPDIAWRLALVFPAVLSFFTAAFFYFFSEDCPLGNHKEVKNAGLMMARSAMDSFRSGALNLNSWILFLQFAGSGGVDTTMSNGAAIYYHDRFKQSTATAGVVAGLYGVSAVFARGLGGYLSDEMNKRMSMRGRLWAQMVSMTLQGVLSIWWARTDMFGTSVVVMIIFSVIVQISIGTCYSIVPYVDGTNTGSVAGIVGAGGNVGAIILGLKFRSDDYADSAAYMGWFTILLALLTPFIIIKGYRGLIFGKEDISHTRQGVLLVPTR